MSRQEKDIIVRRQNSLEPKERYVEYDSIKFEEIKVQKRRRAGRVAAFTVCAIIILCVALALSLISHDRYGSGGMNTDIPWWSDSIGGTHETYSSTNTEGTGGESEKNSESDTDALAPKGGIYDFDYSLVPNGEIPIIPMDLSLSSYGASYIQNSTGLFPDVQLLLNVTLGYSDLEYIATYSAPTVLIIHTHGTESYSEDRAISYKDNGGELARSSNTDENVVTVGRALGEALRERGINSVHCEIMHDSDGYREAYARAEETIREYLERYPTIRLVIDLHRDSVIKSTGELVRPVAEIEGEAAAQIMCVVGSDYGGEANPKWEANLALALQFREYINSEYDSLCRPVYLKSSTYNQEIAPYSMLIEVGAAGNSLEEALRVCDVMAEAICAVLLKK